MGWVHGGGTAVGMLAEMLAAGLNANLGGRDHIPVEVERQIVEWTRQMFGFPNAASGIFVTGTSMANLMAVLVARTSALGRSVRKRGIGDEGASLTAYASKAAHGRITKAMDIAGFGGNALRCIEVDRSHRVDVAALRARIALDRDAGLKTFSGRRLGRNG
jgi:glutamate/tyrosine decarboxylase-like PLP-dependent enzyme